MLTKKAKKRHGGLFFISYLAFCCSPLPSTQLSPYALSNVAT